MPHHGISAGFNSPKERHCYVNVVFSKCSKIITLDFEACHCVVIPCEIQASKLVGEIILVNLA
jgi:hypothetical protein